MSAIHFLGFTNINEKNGKLRGSKENCAVSELPFRVYTGDVLEWNDPSFLYRIAFYDETVKEELPYTYTYAPDSNWASYREDLSDREWTCGSRTFTKDGFVRIAIRRGDGGPFEPSSAGTLFSIRRKAGAGYRQPAYLAEETKRVSARAAACMEDGSTVLYVVADTHNSVNGNWPHTACDLRQMAGKIRPDAVVHLGDLTDGTASKEATKELAEEVLEDCRRVSQNMYLCIGNHDANYHLDNPDIFSEQEQARVYLGRERKYYFEDLPERKLRMFFLDSFDYTKRPNERRYGFSAAQVRWVDRNLKKMPADWSALVFSHVPLLGRMHYWSREIRNGDRLLAVLSAQQEKYGNILACINGHSHADQTELSFGFPLIQIGCSKLECFPEGKPAGSVTYARSADDATADLWDVLILNKDKTRMDLVRFGAGHDRSYPVGRNAVRKQGSGK